MKTQSEGNKMSLSGCGCSIGVGTLLGLMMSFILNGITFWWALFHAFCGWAYILYALIWRAKDILPALRRWFL